MTDSSHLAAPSSGRTSGDAAPTDQIAGPVARINSRVHNCIEWLDANAAANLPNGTPLFTHRPTDDKLFTRPTPAAAADWQISAIADKHVSTFDGRRVLDEVSFGRELLQTLASPAAAAGVPTLTDERITELGHRHAWRYKKSSDPHHSDTYTFNGCCLHNFARAIERSANPAAPVGAPTKLLSVHAALSMCRAANEEARLPVPMCWDLALYVSKLEAQGCELATDATKQQMFNGLTQAETDATASVMGLVHLAATPIDQDFRRRPASSEAAPSALLPCPFCAGEAEIIRTSVHCNSPFCEAQPFTAGQTTAEAVTAWNRRPSAAPSAEGSEAETLVRSLLWDEHPECCGCPVEDTGGEYMGQRETVMSCCGNPEPALLADAQIVASLRERFPAPLKRSDYDKGCGVAPDGAYICNCGSCE